MTVEEIWDHIKFLTEWLDAKSAPSEDPRILRCFKIAEEVGEVGEVAAAVIGATGQNPRKGFSHTWEDVEHELCDVILSAMLALYTIAPSRAADLLSQYAATRHVRAVQLAAQ